MIAVLDPLHNKLKKVCVNNSICEISIDMRKRGQQPSERHLRSSIRARVSRGSRSRRYLRYGDPTEPDKAWEIYCALFRKIEKQMPQLVASDLQYVSSGVLRARNLDLAFPGRNNLISAPNHTADFYNRDLPERA